MKVSFEEIGRVSATFAFGGGGAGQVCKVTENGTVGACGAGERFCGVMEAARNGFCGVQLRGFARVAYSGTAPAAGYNILAADGAGGVKTGETGREYLVVDVDTAGGYATIEL